MLGIGFECLPLSTGTQHDDPPRHRAPRANFRRRAVRRAHAGAPSQATGSVEDASKGTIYVYAWEGGDGKSEIVRGIFALDTERMMWTKVADQSDSKSFDTYFRVSRDGRFLAFARRESSGPPDRVVGISIRDLTRDGAIRKLSAVGFNPFWSSDGKQLMMAAGKGEVPGTKMSKLEAWIVNADGSEPRKLPIPETDQVDDWSPDGTWVVTGSHRDQGVGYQIYRMRLDGTEARRLTTTGAGVLNLDGRISPDGRQIAYWRIGDRQSGIWVMDADGTNARRIFDSTTEGVIPGCRHGLPTVRRSPVPSTSKGGTKKVTWKWSTTSLSYWISQVVHR